MACYYPVGTTDKSGKLSERPCGQCIGCRLEYSRQWAIRCYHESTLHDENCFLTLTYDDDHIPLDQSLNKRDLQLFMKRLRRSIEPKEVRYFACGEYGDNFFRPHYHCLLFGYDFEDKEIFECGKFFDNRKGNRHTGEHDTFKSKKLEKLWKNGFCTIGKVSLDSAAYVARYHTKKITGKEAPDYYNGRQPEFAAMSRRPGIGKPWFDKFFTDLYPKDFFTINGRKMRPIKYYDYLLSKLNPKLFSEIKERRIKKIGLLNPKIKRVSPKERWLKSKYKKAITKNLNRRIEHGN